MRLLVVVSQEGGDVAWPGDNPSPIDEASCTKAMEAHGALQSECQLTPP